VIGTGGVQAPDQVAELESEGATALRVLADLRHRRRNRLGADHEAREQEALHDDSEATALGEGDRLGPEQPQVRQAIRPSDAAPRPRPVQRVRQGPAQSAPVIPLDGEVESLLPISHDDPTDRRAQAQVLTGGGALLHVLAVQPDRLDHESGRHVGTVRDTQSGAGRRQQLGADYRHSCRR
jgi:hypothetical protein